MSKLTAEEVAEAIGIPTEEWPGNCYGIACAMLKAGLVNGKAQYGHFLGEIHPEAQCFGGRVLTHHGWIKQDDWLIIDPTRWVFENVEPYIYYGPADDPEYDFGSNNLRMQRLQPCPSFNKDQDVYLIPGELFQFCEIMVGTRQSVLSVEQVMWFANLPLQILDDRAESVFRWIAEDVGLPGFIPVDNRVEILGE